METPKLSLREIADALGREPLVGTTVAARILGIKAPNFKRDAAPHLTAVQVEGSAAVYFRSQVEGLAREWGERKALRQARQAASDGHADG